MFCMVQCRHIVLFLLFPKTCYPPPSIQASHVTIDKLVNCWLSKRGPAFLVLKHNQRLVRNSEHRMLFRECKDRNVFISILDELFLSEYPSCQFLSCRTDHANETYVIPSLHSTQLIQNVSQSVEIFSLKVTLCFLSSQVSISKTLIRLSCLAFQLELMVQPGVL